MELCGSAKACGSDSGKLTLKTCETKRLRCCLYYPDKEYGFMFIRIQTRFPFHVRVYINGRERTKSAFEENGVAYQCYDNSFADISDAEKAREPANSVDSAKPRRRPDGTVSAPNPFLDTVTKTFGQGRYRSVGQREYATDIIVILLDYK